MCDSSILQPLNFICSKASPPSIVQIHQLGFLSSVRRQENAYRCSALNSVIFTAVGTHPE